MKIRPFLVTLGWTLLGCAVLAALFSAYQHPALLIDFSNLLFCG
jgi:hypothetical protein